MLKVNRWQGHHKALKRSLIPIPDGGKCLNIYVPLEGQSDHLGRLGGGETQEVTAADLVIYRR